MFGTNDQNQQSNDDPAMLDNVKQLASQPADQVEPPQMGASSSPVTTMPAPTATADDTTTNDSISSDLDNPAHLEVPEGFSSNPLPAAPAPESETPTPEETPAEHLSGFSMTDTTSPLPAEQSPETPVNEAPPTPAEPPSIQSTSAPADSSFAQPAQNDVSAPPELNSAEDTTGPSSTLDLNSIKNEALGHLEDVAGHVGGSPEEVFKTTMDMIKANNNHDLFQKALDSAKKIEDDKARAEALQKIIEEINNITPEN